MRKLALLLLLIPSVAFGQSVRYQNQAISNRGIPLANQNVAVCSQPANTSTQPCSPLATLATSTSTTSGGANPLTTDSLGNFFFYAAPGRYTVQIYGPQVSTAFVQPDTVLACDPTGACTHSGAETFTQQIVSTVTTGTAPFSIASTTVVPNLNAQLHGGLTAPASAIVGISDTQNLTNKTVDGFAIAHAASQASAATNFGTALSSQTVVSSVPSTGVVNLLFQLVQVTAGVGCSASSNTVQVNLVTYTAPGGNTAPFNPSVNLTITGNGFVDDGEPGQGGGTGFNNVETFGAKAGTSISYTTTSTLGSTGCTTTPQYTIFAKAFF